MDSEIERIALAARHSIGRAFLFTLLAVGATMSGLIGWPVMAFRTGAVLWMLAAAILMLRGLGTTRRPYRRTEAWILLGRSHGLPEEQAQAVFARVLTQTYRRFAEYAAVLSLGFWIVAFTLTLILG